MRLLTTVLVALLALGQGAGDLGGTWKGGMETQMGTTAVTITLKSGAGLAGTLRIGEYEGAIEKAKLDGGRASFQVAIEPGTLTFEGSVAGDEMKLTVTGTQGDKYALVCKRQK